MSIGANSAVSFSQGKITDSTLRLFQDQDVKIVKELQIAIEQEFPHWEEEYGKMQKFKVNVNNRRSDLQHERVVIPSPEQLRADERTYVQQYWQFLEVCEKMNLFANRIEKTMMMMTPRLRTYAESQTLEKEQPALMEQIKEYENCCLQQIKELKTSFEKIDTLQKTMITFLKNDTASSVQRFCQIVDNHGKPLSTLQWATSKMTTPVVPLLSQTGEKKETFSKHEKSLTSSTETQQSEGMASHASSSNIGSDLMQPTIEGKKNLDTQGGNSYKNVTLGVQNPNATDKENVIKKNKKTP